MAENVDTKADVDQDEIGKLISELFRDWFDSVDREQQRRRPLFTNSTCIPRTDDSGAEFLLFDDDRGWVINLPLFLIGKNASEISVKDHVFQLTDNIFAFIHYASDNATPQIFLLNHWHMDNSSDMIRTLWYERGKTMALLRGGGTSEKGLLSGIEAMPCFKGGFPSNFVTVFPWTTNSISGRFSGEPVEAYQARTADLHTPLQIQQVYHQIPSTLKNNFLELNAALHGITYFSTVYASGDEAYRSKLEKLSVVCRTQGLSSAFLNAFGACEVDRRIGEAIAQTLETPYGPDVLKRDEELFLIMQQFFSRRPGDVARILSLQSQHQNWGEVLGQMYAKLDLNVFRTVMTRKRAELWNAAAKTEPNWSDFNCLTIFWGALFKAITSHLNLPEASEMVELLLQDSKIQVITGDANFLADPNGMFNSDNYLRPDEFGLEDYLVLREGIEKTYRHIDPKACDELIAHVPYDLMDPNVTRILIRKKGKLVANAKIKPHVKNGVIVPNEFEFGNFYVFDPVLQGSYGLGQAMKHFAFAMVPENGTVVGQTSLLNPTLQGNIDLGWEVGREIVRIGDGLPFVETAHHHTHAAYLSKSMERHEIKRQAVETNLNSNPPFTQEIYYFKADTSKNAELFGSFLREFFEKGYVLTRIFYDEDTKRKPDLKNTYFVLEKARSSNA